MKKSGFTLFEVLLAVCILSVGATTVFQGFFMSASALRHIDNRIYADLVMAQKIWEIKDMLNTGAIKGGYSLRSSEGTDTKFDCAAQLVKTALFTDLYTLTLRISWTEGRRAITLNRHLYIAKV
ncbi:MAG: prepilin-type N-terminal cleavage/methylation domain-containing protein [Candidatus Omnitrophota bacterium]|nr:prepilin-type N-terminal cleavage/methylation domain-containing protein [Candidatus Omnitrophota bacterium]